MPRNIGLFLFSFSFLHLFVQFVVAATIVRVVLDRIGPRRAKSLRPSIDLQREHHLEGISTTRDEKEAIHLTQIRVHLEILLVIHYLYFEHFDTYKSVYTYKDISVVRTYIRTRMYGYYIQRVNDNFNTNVVQGMKIHNKWGNTFEE